MAESDKSKTVVENANPETLESGTYEIIRDRLNQQGTKLRKRLAQLNEARQEVFGSIKTELLQTNRITTENNCIARDMIPIGNFFILGYNVHLGLRVETHVKDVFSVYQYQDHEFSQESTQLLQDERFEADFQNLYKYYKNAQFTKFSVIGQYLYMIFQVGKSIRDIKTFKWLIEEKALRYVDNRSDHEFKFPNQHEFRWTRTHRDFHRKGDHPHISIDDRIFVEAVGGDLTIKIEDNTDSGEGIYAEEVKYRDQSLDDAEIFFTSLGNNIILKIKPYQEKEFRYLVYNEKLQEVHRIDAIEDSCVLLPDDHGLIFSNGYYLDNGEFKEFEHELSNMLFEKRIASPNGEDFLYIFYNQVAGAYVLLSYNLIEQKVAIPIVCHGSATFANGEMIYFKSDETPQKHHTLQIWQTPYVDSAYSPEIKTDSFLNKIGNKDIVRGMSECTEILNLLKKDDSYGGLYLDLVKKSADILDSYFWLEKEETFNLKEVLLPIKDTASTALEEFEKVSRIRKSTKEAIEKSRKETDQLLSKTKRVSFQRVEEYVSALAELRALRGGIISLKDLRYTDLPLIQKMELSIQERADRVSLACVEFLLKPEALLPYQERVAEYRQQIPDLLKAAEAQKLGEQVDQLAADLDLLIETVSNLKIDDSTRTTQIIDFVSEVYTELNQTRALLKKRKKELLSTEAIAEFNAQLKLLNQAILNYLDVSDTVNKCEEYLTKLMVQLEELEGKFSEFDEFILQLSEKREEIYNAFESKKLQLQEKRNRRSAALQSSAERILKGIKNRLAKFKTVNEINGYFAADLMIDKVRNIVKELVGLDDSVKADDLQTRLKTSHEEAVRQLKDRQELFLDGENVIKFGPHHFSVNVQALDATIVRKQDGQYFHLIGTDFFKQITDPEFLKTRDVWNQELPSENGATYRSEYLASLFWDKLESETENAAQLLDFSVEQLAGKIKTFMGSRYDEGYVKGVHDGDAARLLHALIRLKHELALLRFPAEVRACAMLYWKAFVDEKTKERLTARMTGMGLMRDLFPDNREGELYMQNLTEKIDQFVQNTGLFSQVSAKQSGEYLYHELMNADSFVISREASELHLGFSTYLKKKHFLGKFEGAIRRLDKDLIGKFELIHSWLSAYTQQDQGSIRREYLTEATTLILTESWEFKYVVDVPMELEITEMLGEHSSIQGGNYQLNYIDFQKKLLDFQQVQVPKFTRYTVLKKSLVEDFKKDLRLEEFKPRVLSSFVRNQLINKVFLPLIGDNLAKQIGVVGEQTRTDRMGLLLLISPPGYGKTTLMEYIASRLGVVFMKINGPAIGNAVTSLDPMEAPNASAREEVMKLNLSLEMGDNVMIYLDDIQHCNPEFLQKFISLCDGSRRIEGVYEGKSKTYDLRGKKVSVVMAGNPYTESGDKFQIPDMLANRADTYNLGDIIGDQADAFKLSYLENCLVSNPVLNTLAAKSRKDIYALIDVAATGNRDGLDLEGNYSTEEINSYINVLKKLITVRDVILKVNLEYIRSASQADEYRTEPSFKLQGSYRNMAKLAEKILPIMNEQELHTLILSHYEQESQTLTNGAEENFLKFKELIEVISPEEQTRWSEIKKIFCKNLMMGGNSADSMGKLLGQLSNFSEGLEGIRVALEEPR